MLRRLERQGKRRCGLASDYWYSVPILFNDESPWKQNLLSLAIFRLLRCCLELSYLWLHAFSSSSLATVAFSWLPMMIQSEAFVGLENGFGYVWIMQYQVLLFFFWNGLDGRFDGCNWYRQDWFMTVGSYWFLCLAIRFDMVMAGYMV